MLSSLYLTCFKPITLYFYSEISVVKFVFCYIIYTLIGTSLLLFSYSNTFIHRKEKCYKVSSHFF